MNKKTITWNKMGDHPAVWQDYISTCGGDTDIDKYYIGSGSDPIEVVRGSMIIDMDDGTFKVVRPST